MTDDDRAILLCTENVTDYCIYTAVGYDFDYESGCAEEWLNRI
jgi:hypothetical protein